MNVFRTLLLLIGASGFLGAVAVSWSPTVSWRPIWLWLLAVGLITELAALTRGVRGDTLSEVVWSIRETGSGIFSLIIFFLLWLVYHFIVEGRVR